MRGLTPNEERLSLGDVANEPTLTDRVVQQAIAQVLTPIFDPTFSESSFSFRPGRIAHQAIREVQQVQATVNVGRRIAVDLDLAKFFDTVNHDVLMNRLRRTIADKRLLALIGSYLRAGAEPGHKASSGRLVPCRPRWACGPARPARPGR